MILLSNTSLALNDELLYQPPTVSLSLIEIKPPDQHFKKITSIKKHNLHDPKRSSMVELVANLKKKP